MISKISILIADYSLENSSVLKEFINNQSDMEVIESTNDGIKTIDAIDSLKPDIVILDILLPSLDGIAILDHYSKISGTKKPIFIIFSRVSKETFIQKSFSLGASYYIIKPFNIDILIQRIREIYLGQIQP